MKKIFFNLSIKEKLTVIIIFVTMLTVVSWFTIVTFIEIKTARKELLNNVVLNARFTAEYCVAPLIFDDSVGANIGLSKLETIPNILDGYVFDKNGKLFAAYHRFKEKTAALPDLIGNISTGFYAGCLHVVEPIIYENQCEGTIYLRVSTSELYLKIKNYILTGLLLLIGFMLFTYLLAHQLQKSISGPILNLATTIRKISEESNYNIRIEKKGNDEIGVLYDGFNEMVGRVEREKQERDKVYAELRENEQFLANLFESVQDGVSVLSRDLTIRRVNGVMERWYAENLPLEGKLCYQAYHNSDKPCDPCPTTRCLKSGQTEHDIVPGIPGSPVEYIELFSYPMKDRDSGEITGAVEFVRDITEREIIRRELIKEKIFADTLVQTAPVLYVAIGADGKTIMMNDFMLKILGYTKDEITGKDYLTSFVPEDDREMLAGVFNKLTSAHQATLNENRILTKDGSKYLVEWHGKPILNEKGLFQYFFGVGIDITERRKSENELRKYHEHLEELVKERTKELEDKTVTIAKSQEALTYLMEDVNDARQELEIAKSRLEISNRDLEAFAYSVSHDLRAPLRHVDGFAELLMSQSADKLDEKGRSYLDKIITASQNMGTLIDDLLAFSRIGRKEIFKIPVELNSMIEKIKDELESDIKNRKVSWRVDQLGIVRADPTLIKQVFVNLMSNALKYTRPRKEAKIEIGLKKSDENEKIIYIKDNGVGFDMKYSDKLFGVFQRLHSSSDFEGTGIGLANVRRIINRHGGRVWAEAEIDKGAAFYISLPNVGGKVEGEGKG